MRSKKYNSKWNINILSGKGSTKEAPPWNSQHENLMLNSTNRTLCSDVDQDT